MKLKGRELVEGLAGDDVTDLHDELVQVGFPIDDGERKRRHFGKTTHEAVLRFQEGTKLEPTGVVDEVTAQRLGEAVGGGSDRDRGPVAIGIVRGVVRTPTRAPVPGLTVAAYQLSLRGQELLGEVVAGEDGSFYLEYTRPQRVNARPDLRAAALRDREEVGSSETVYNAPQAVEVVVEVPEAAVDTRPEFARLVDAITPFVAAAGLRSVGELDGGPSGAVTYLANKTGWDARAVAMTVAAERMAYESGVPSELYYALFRAGLPANVATLGRLPRTTATNVWRDAIKAGVVSPDHEPALEEHAERFAALGAEAVLAAEPQIGVSSLENVLDVAGLEREQMMAVAKLHTDSPNADMFWGSVREQLGEDVASELSVVGKLAYLTINNAPLMRTLASDRDLKDPVDLVTAGLYDAGAWTQLLADVTVPPEIPGATDDARREAYADLLAAQLKLSYPTAVVGSMVERGAMPVVGGDGVSREVARFLVSNQGAFELGDTPVSQFVKTSGAELSPTAVKAVQTLQRQYQMTPSDSTMRVLADAKLDSAFAVTRYEQPTFVAMYAGSLGGEANARLVYSKAEQIHNVTVNVATSYLTERNRTDMYVLPGDVGLLERVTGEEGETEAEATYADVIAYATLEQLFGEMDYCACDHCRSVLSPAAYLVDLLAFIDHRKLNGAGDELPLDIEKENPVDVLLSRRPDIALLQLTCENTNTALPCVDLVNEILEHYVVNSSLTTFSGHDTGPDDTSEDLVASPRHLLPAAYTLLAEQSFPLSLPFHRPLSALRAYMKRFDTTLADAMEMLRGNNDLDAADPATGYGWRDILLEQLGVSRQQHRLLAGDDVTLAELFGFATGTSDADVIASVSNARTLARRLDITYEQVVDILRTSFVNEAGWLLTLLDRLGITFATIEELHTGAIDAAELLRRVGDVDPEPYGGDIAGWLTSHYDEIASLIALTSANGSEDLCSFESMELRRALPPPSRVITPADALRIVRFVRLWRALGYSIEETDKVAAALFPTEFRPEAGDDDEEIRSKLGQGMAALLLRAAHLRQLMDGLGVKPKRDLLRVLSIWAPIDTVGPKSLYRQLFLSPSVEQDDAFAEDGSAVVLTGGQHLVAHLSTLRAALNVTDAELAALIEDAGLDDQAVLDLANVSSLRRRAYLARKLKLSIREMRALAELTGLDPYAGPEAPRASTVEFVRQVRALRDGGLTAPVLMYLVRHELVRGAAHSAALSGAARSFHAELARIEREHVVVDDPNGEVAKAKMALVYGQEAADTFFGLLTGVARFEVPYAQAGPTLDAALTTAVPTLGYDHLRKRLTNAGVMSDTERDALLALPGTPAALAAAVIALHASGRTASQAFFGQYPDLATLHAAVTVLPAAERTEAILAHFLPALRRELQELYVVQALAAESGATPAEVRGLVDDHEAVHAVGDTTTPAMADFLAIASSGASMQVHFGADVSTPADVVEPVVPTIAFDASNPLPTDPANPANPVSGVWRWDLDPTAGGFYAFTIEADAGSTVSLTIDGNDVTLLADAGRWTTQDALEFHAGRLYRFVLTVRTVHDRLRVLWESLGVARTAIPTEHMRPSAAVDRFTAAYARMLKVFELADAVELDGAEIAWFATRPALAVAGAGWLNALPISLGSAPAPSVQQDLVRRLETLALYAGLRQAVKGDDGRLLRVLADPARLLDDGTLERAAVTGWDEAAVTAALTLLGRTAAALADVHVLERVRRIVELSKVTGVPVDVLAANVRNDPTEAHAATVQAALRSRYDADGWAQVVKPINDELRDAQRDALVAHVLRRLSGDTATEHIDTTEKLFEYFLIDVAMEPCMLTSRIRSALSAVQLFIQRCLLNLETRVAASSINSARWSWMKRYRVWEANRKVFLFPENWLDPALRDDKSVLFRDLESQLLEADITEDAAARAMGNYLMGLAEVAKLEICGMFVEQFDGGTPADDIVRVVGRTAGVRRKYFYRQARRGVWTPWEPVGADIEDTPVIPVVWRGRVFLFWLRLIQAASSTTGATTTSSKPLVDVQTSELRTSVSNRSLHAVLEWSERANGAWQPVQGSDIQRPATIATGLGPTGFDRSNVALGSKVDDDGSLVITISNGTSSTYFRLFNTHSLPVRQEDEPLVIPSTAKVVVVTVGPFRERAIKAGGGLDVNYVDLALSFVAGGTTFTHQVLERGQWEVVTEPWHQLSNMFTAPFFFSDRHHVFFVEPSESVVTVPEFGGLGIEPFVPLLPDRIKVPPIKLIPEKRLEDIIPELNQPYPPDIYRGVYEPHPVDAFVRDSNIKVAIDALGTFTLDDAVISPLGNVEIPERSINR